MQLPRQSLCTLIACMVVHGQLGNMAISFVSPPPPPPTVMQGAIRERLVKQTTFIDIVDILCFKLRKNCGKVCFSPRCNNFITNRCTFSRYNLKGNVTVLLHLSS